ncbi:MAG: PHP domain-containing protein, partial [Waddliaceae bacterium]|nr:PHP domain-containing protein [Waddliaceae bacterium]
MSWVPLHVHSQYSILDATASVKRIAEKAAALEMPAVAITDHGNMFGAVDFFKACSSKGVKPIIGCEVYVATTSRHEKQRIAGKKNAYHLVLLAKNQEGYHNICKLSSIGHLEGFYYVPRVDKEALEQYSEGVICLSGCLSGRVTALAADEAVTDDVLYEEIQWYQKLY